MLRRVARALTPFLLATIWFALAFGLTRLCYKAAPWFIRTAPSTWIARFVDWYAPNSGAEEAADAEFLGTFMFCLLVSGVILAVPWTLARLTSRPRELT